MNVLTGLRYASCEQVMQIVANNAAKVDLSFATKAARVECRVLRAAYCPLRLLMPGASWCRKFFVSQTQRSTSRCAKRTNSATHTVPSRRTFAGKYGGRDHAADEAGVEANG